MNEETTVTTATETTIPVVTDATDTAPEASTPETMETTETIPIVYDTEVQETETTALITVEELHRVRDDVINADLFGSFLICGVIAACALCRRLL